MKLENVIASIGDYTMDAIMITQAEPLVYPGPQIVWCNKAYEKHSGYKLEEMIGKSPRMLQGQKSDQATLKRISEKLKKWEHVREEVLNYKKDGSEYWVDLSIIPVADENGWFHYWVSVQRDITSRVAREQAIVRAQKSAEEANRAKDTFLAVMSHEIRTPLNGLIGMMGLIDREDLSEDARGKLDICAQSAETLKVLLNDILDLAKIEAGQLDLEKAPFNIEALATEQVSMMSALAEEKSIKLAADLSGLRHKNALGDSVRLRQVISNLLSNALKFTQKGSVTLRLSSDEKEGALGALDIQLKCEVIDTGIGIPADRTDHVFSPFEQAEKSTTRRYGGTGLGLAICKRIIEQMGGDIEVKSTLGKGSNFHFNVVLETAETAVPSEVTETINLDHIENMKALVLEDNKINQMLVSALLKKKKISAQMAENGKVGITMLRDMEPKPDFILCDMLMPEMDGLEAAQAIRNGTAGDSVANLPIIALTANALSGDREKCLDAGMTDYVSKPIDENKLYEAIARHTK